MKKAYCLYHKRWLNKNNIKEKCLKNDRGKQCKHLIVLKKDYFK